MANDIDRIPDDPLAMPPPFWRSAGAIFHILRALDQLVGHLAELVRVKIDTEERLDAYFASDPEPSDDDPAFGMICGSLWVLESEVVCDAYSD